MVTLKFSKVVTGMQHDSIEWPVERKGQIEQVLQSDEDEDLHLWLTD
jgi:hypothetical protein